MSEMRLNPDTMHDTLTWVVSSAQSSDWAIADLLAVELDPRARSAVELLTSSETTLATLVAAKSLFKALRLEGETAEDRRLGSVLYAAAIASALVFFNERISRQRAVSLKHAIMRMEDDLSLPEPLRVLACRAKSRLSAAS